ncbi:hypothetical protein RvVAR0630_30300 [Agrobacterium vitis]|uniref:hypothetical protein n=1 Tax=Agrobacterium vitis TaxID=373 RepID=UPI0015D77F7B|nr:hypothetical protein [Agrobacterium vitis]BCH60406.1 hypothetical protein RvVAR0630_30300 [Agrobacterium vitis]
MKIELRQAICDVMILARTIKDNPAFDDTSRAAAARVVEQAGAGIYIGSGWTFRLWQKITAA